MAGDRDQKKLAESIQTAVSGALSSVLTPMLQNLNRSSASEDRAEADNSDDDFIAPMKRKR